MARIVLVSDCNFLVNRKEVICIGSAPEEVLEEIEELTRTETVDLFLISLDYIPIGKEHIIQRTTHIGIEVLKRLRLKRYQQHCVVFSFLPREHFILSDPKNLLLYAPGVIYYQLPIDLQALDFNRLKALQAPQDLSAFFRAEVQVADDRHFIANWWGVYTLWQVHKVIQTYQGQVASPQQGQVETLEDFFKATQAWKHMNSLQGLLAQYLNPIEKDNIINQLNELQEVKETKRQLEEQIDTQYTSIEKQGKEEIIENIIEKNIEIIRKIIKENIEKEFEKKENIDSSYIETLEKTIEALENEIKEKYPILEANKELEDIENEIKKKIKKEIEKRISSPKIVDKVKEIRKNFQEKPPKIIYIDDNANEGWSKIFCRMIYGKDQSPENFITITPIKELEIENVTLEKLEEWAKKIVGEIIQKAKEIDLLILDLRLQGEKGQLPVEKVSGLKVLEELKRQNFPYPILITTASNKWISYKQTKELRAIGYWQKKGLDERNDTESILMNYIDFLEKVHLLCYDERIQFLYRIFLPLVTLIKMQKEFFWWQTAFWRGREKKEKVYVNQKEVLEIIDVQGDKIVAKNQQGIVFEYDKTDVIIIKKDINSIIQGAWDLYSELLTETIIKKKNTELDNKENAIVVIFLFQALEYIYSRKKESDLNFPRNVMLFSDFRSSKNYGHGFDQKLSTFIHGINNVRNKAVHQLSTTKEELHFLIEGILKFITNEWEGTDDKVVEEKDVLCSPTSNKTKDIKSKGATNITNSKEKTNTIENDKIDRNKKYKTKIFRLTQSKNSFSLERIVIENIFPYNILVLIRNVKDENDEAIDQNNLNAYVGKEVEFSIDKIAKVKEGYLVYVKEAKILE